MSAPESCTEPLNPASMYEVAVASITMAGPLDELELAPVVLRERVGTRGAACPSRSVGDRMTRTRRLRESRSFDCPDREDVDPDVEAVAVGPLVEFGKPVRDGLGSFGNASIGKGDRAGQVLAPVAQVELGLLGGRALQGGPSPRIQLLEKVLDGLLGPGEPALVKRRDDRQRG